MDVVYFSVSLSIFFFLFSSSTRRSSDLKWLIPFAPSRPYFLPSSGTRLIYVLRARLMAPFSRTSQHTPLLNWPLYHLYSLAISVETLAAALIHSCPATDKNWGGPTAGALSKLAGTSSSSSSSSSSRSSSWTIDTRSIDRLPTGLRSGRNTPDLRFVRAGQQ